ncbi:hypothetical protein [Mucilaginibacter antarcticus]|uniref:hypothetical protein n=1 Tax=Mucilaginibacter antarcticus TaxID=1855725 RepID=UPI0036426964
MPVINFFEEDISYKLKDKLKVKRWISETIMAEGYKLNELSYIFVRTHTYCGSTSSI